MTRKVYQADFGSQADLMVLSAAANPIHNGGFDVWQRGATFLGMADGTYMADRWRYGKLGSTAVHAGSRGTSPPAIAATVPGSNHNLDLVVTTADAAIAAGDLIFIEHRMEGYTWVPYAQKQFTVGFWVYSSVTGTYCVAARNSGSDQSCNIEYTISAADTWEYKTVTFPASPSAGTWDYTTGVGLSLSWVLAAGSTYQATTGSWSSTNTLASASQVNAVGVFGNDFSLWGVTMGLGSTVAPFWPRPYGEAMALCQRYFRVWGGNSTTESVASGQCVANNSARILLPLDPPMRAAPTMSVSAATDWAVVTATNTITELTSFTFAATSAVVLGVAGVAATPLVAGDATRLLADTTASARLYASADL